MSQAHVKPARFVRCDPEMATSQLFVPLSKARQRPPLQFTIESKSGRKRLRFSAREALGIPEQTLFLVLLELAQEHYGTRPAELTVINPTRAQGLSAYLWQTLHDGHPVNSGESIYVQTTWYEVGHRCGSLGGRARHLRREQLQRLSEVVVWEEDDEAQNAFRQSRLVSVWLGDDRVLHLAVNVRLARAIMGGQYVPVSLRERLELATDTAQALHASLSARIRFGHSWRFGVDTLVHQLYPGSDAAPGGTLRRRRKLVRDALEQVGGLLGWSVEWAANQVALVTRKPFKVDGVTRRERPRMQPAVLHAFQTQPNPRDCADVFDATCFLEGVTDSPPSWTIGHNHGD